MNLLHQIWIGPKPIPREWINSWRDLNPDLDYYLWDESGIDNFGLKNRDKYDYYYSRGMYDGACDVARVEILEYCGGVYVDADSICLEPIQNEWFMKKDFFAGLEYDRRVANGVIGAKAHHPILLDYMNRISEATVLEPACYTIGGTMLTSCIDTFGTDDSVAILPSHYFYPKWKHRGEITGKIYSRHMWGSTKNLYE